MSSTRDHWLRPKADSGLGGGAKWTSEHNTANLSHQQEAEQRQESTAENQSEGAIFLSFSFRFLSEP